MDIIDMSVMDNSAAEHLVSDERENFLGHRWWDSKMWFYAYHRGYREGRYPVPAILHVEELVHGNDERVHFFVMYADHARGTWKIVGDGNNILI